MTIHAGCGLMVHVLLTPTGKEENRITLVVRNVEKRIHYPILQDRYGMTGFVPKLVITFAKPVVS